MKKESRRTMASIVAIVIACVSLTISIVNSSSAHCSCGSNMLSVLIGVCATFMVCYQIWNTIDVKETVKDVEKITGEFSNLKQKVEESEKNMKGNMDIINSLITYNNHTSLMYVSDSVLFMHHAVLSGLDAKRENFDFIFNYLSLFISELTEMSITGATVIFENSHKEKIINDRRSPYYGKLVSYTIDVFTSQVKEIDDKIRKHQNYSGIHLQYEKIMESLYEKLREIREGVVTDV